jgi:hypothetical protein
VDGGSFLLADFVAACANEVGRVAWRGWRLFRRPEILHDMKTAYELAMERLNRAAPAVKLTDTQKKQLAELDSTYAAKMAGREIALKDEIMKVSAAGDAEKVEALQQQWVKERQSLQAELEKKKDRIRQGSATK